MDISGWTVSLNITVMSHVAVYWQSDEGWSRVSFSHHRGSPQTSSAAGRTETGPEASACARSWRVSALYLRTCIPVSASAAGGDTASVRFLNTWDYPIALFFIVCKYSPSVWLCQVKSVSCHAGTVTMMPWSCRATWRPAQFWIITGWTLPKSRCVFRTHTIFFRLNIIEHDACVQSWLFEREIVYSRGFQTGIRGPPGALQKIARGPPEIL